MRCGAKDSLETGRQLSREVLVVVTPSGLGEHPQNPRNSPQNPLRSSRGETRGSGPAGCLPGGHPPSNHTPSMGSGGGNVGTSRPFFPRDHLSEELKAPLPLAWWPEAAARLRAGTRSPPGRAVLSSCVPSSRDSEGLPTAEKPLIRARGTWPQPPDPLSLGAARVSGGGWGRWRGALRF